MHKFVTSDVTLWHLHMENHGILKYIQLWPSLFPYSISLHLPHFASIPSINIKTCSQIINLFTLHVILNINVSTRYLTFTCILESLIFIWWYMAYPQYWINKAWMWLLCCWQDSCPLHTHFCPHYCRSRLPEAVALCQWCPARPLAISHLSFLTSLGGEVSCQQRCRQ